MAGLPIQPTDRLRLLEGKLAIVTGASRGIGRGIAIQLGLWGCNVVVNYRQNDTEAQEVVSRLRSFHTKPFALKADVSERSEITKLFQQAKSIYNGVDFVVSNAGKLSSNNESNISEQLFDDMFGLNCKGQYFVAKEALKRCNPGGKIILVSSVGATMSGVPVPSLYAGSKAATEAFVRALSMECGERQITVNGIAPGVVKTDMYQRNCWRFVPGGHADMATDAIDQHFANMCPLQRVGTPEDIGNVVSLLCLPQSKWINGKSPIT